VNLDPQQPRGIPLYVQLRELIREEIRQAQWAPDQPLPSEAELQARYSLSRSTVRRALADLTQEGLLVRFPGRGTFASQPRIVLGMRGLQSLRADLVARGIHPRREVLEVSRTALPLDGQRLAPELSDHDVINVFEVRYGDDRPVLIFDQYYPYPRFSFLLKQREEVEDPDGSLFELISSRGITFARAVGEVNAVSASRREAELLKLPAKAPVAEIATKTFDLSGKVIEYSRAIVRTDWYALIVESDWAGQA
jgi:GntR family transcriptional regulator